MSVIFYFFMIFIYCNYPFYVIMAKDLKEEHLNDLTSKVMYNKFDRTNSECDNVRYFSNIKDDLKQYYIFTNISDKLVKALCFIYNRQKNHKENFNKELCSYLYYWIGSQIHDRVSSKQVFSKIIQTLYDELNITDINNMCKPIHNDIDIETFKNNKLLFDYSKDREHIILETVHPGTTCDKHYKMIIQKYMDTYRDAYSNCNGNGKYKYDCSKFSALLKNEPNKELSSFYCKDYKPQTIYLWGTEKRSNPENPLPEDRREEINPGPVSHRDTHRLGSPDHDNRHFRSPAAWDKETLNSDASIPPNDTAEGGTTKTIMGSVTPVLGVSSFSLLLYKVTPLGGIIRNFLGRNRNMYNPVEYIDGFNPYKDGTLPGDRTMNISYHRL